MSNTLIHLRWHRGGIFVNDPYPKYSGGGVSFVHKIDVDTFFFLITELKEYTKDLGYA